MAKRPDELIEFILEEIALCGAQGAGSADFRRFIQQFRENSKSQKGKGRHGSDQPSSASNRRYYEMIWEWLRHHQDVQIVYGHEPRDLSLTEFETLELQETGTSGADYATEQQLAPQVNVSQAATTSRPCRQLHASIKGSLRERLVKEGHLPNKDGATYSVPKVTLSEASQAKTTSHLPTIVETRPTVPEEPQVEREQSSEPGPRPDPRPVLHRRFSTPPGTPHHIQRRPPKGLKKSTQPIFDEIPASTSAPRIKVSQERTWQAVAGHPVDLKKLSAMQFILLSIIAAHGADGIQQPELVRLSGQDKRSVPHRTDELAKAGYIEKTPISMKGLRTSLCVHKRFVKEGHFLKGSGNFEDVFRNRAVILSALVDHLYSVLKETPVLRYSQLRTALAVSKQEWNTRGIRTAVRRLEETGFLERKRIFTKGTQKTTTIVIKLLRPPNDDDRKNLSFRRKPHVQDQSGILEEEEEGDDLMRDLELDLDLNDDEAEDDRIPPQWDPDRLFSNLAYEAIELAGVDGTDASKLRERTMGRFWKRPTESFISRLTDNWEVSQPRHLRHLALIRDTTVTHEKKLVHYVYRTYNNFQRAVDAGQVAWEAVSREAAQSSSSKKGGRAKKTDDESVLDEWGFQVLPMNDFYQRLGTATLSECNSAIQPRRRNGPRWDQGLLELCKQDKRDLEPGMSAQDEVQATQSPGIEQIQDRPPCVAPPPKTAPKKKPPKQLPVPLLSMEQRKALNLPVKGRLGIHIEQQIREHREKTGDPTSLPDIIYTDPADVAKLNLEKRPKEKTAKNTESSKLFTKEFRKAHGLPLYGRLAQSVIDMYRQMEREGTLAPNSGDPKSSGTPDTSQQANVESSASGKARGASTETGISTEATPTETVLSPHKTPVDDTMVTPDTFPRSKETPSRKRQGSLLDRPPESVKKLALEAADSPTPITDDMAMDVDNEALEAAESPIPSIETADNEPGSKKLKKSRSTRARPVPGADAVIKKFYERTEPGVYVNPYATRKISRGRPKKAFMVVFKSPRLAEFDWFLPDPEFMTALTPKERKARSRKNAHVRFVDVTAAEHASPELPPPSPSESDDAEDVGEEVDGNAREESSVSDVTGDRHISKSPGSIQDVAAQATGDSPEAISTDDHRDKANPGVDQPPPGRILTHSGWNAINAPKPAYQSPYQAIPAPTSSGVDNDMQDVPANGGPGGDQTSVSRSPSHNARSAGSSSSEAGTTNENMIENATTTGRSALETYTPTIEVAPNGKKSPGGDVQPVDTRMLGHKRRVKYGAFIKRGVTLGRGSVWAKRKEVVLDILKLCDGLFPFNGEIVAPFFKLWDRGPGKTMARPDRTTITNTINGMIESPEYNIRKLVFRIPGLEGKSTVERFLIARDDIPITSPRIKELQRNMIRTYPHKFYPEEIRHLVGPDAPPRIIPEPAFDTTISLNGVAVTAQNKLDQRVLASSQTRQRRVATKFARTHQKKELAQKSRGRPRRERLEGLSSRKRTSTYSPRYSLDLGRGKLPQRRSMSVSSVSSDDSASSSDTSTDEGCDTDKDTEVPMVTPTDGFSNLTVTDFGRQAHSTGLTNPQVQFYSNSGTFSNNFDGNIYDFVEPNLVRSHKRVRFAEPGAERPRKKRCIPRPTMDDIERKGALLIWDQRMNVIGRKSYKHRWPEPEEVQPTLTERLVGHTGNPNDPVYTIPQKKQAWRPRPWANMKPREKKEPTETVSRIPVEVLEPGDAFKKLFCALAVASVMSGEDGSIDWGIVEKVYRSDRYFSVEKAKKLWSWIQKNMAEQLDALKSEFESSYLEAYEKGQVEGIEDPETHDWKSLVKWAARKCEYASPPLPPSRDDLQDYEIEESHHRGFDRADWVLKNLAHVIRAQRVLKYAYAAPLHRGEELPPVDDALRAKSWIRANTATAQEIYDSNAAHNKLRVLDDSLLERTVYDLCQSRLIRQRKLKKLLPGRNFEFAAAFALKYRQTFDQTVFIEAADFKKTLDAAFANPDPEQRFLAVSRTANDGAVMALLSLVSAGKVMLVPQLPPVNNELGAPTPRLSVWGFMEGDYVHRKIDRNRLFWDIHAIPGDDYPFGNPLQPSPAPESDAEVKWQALPEPPLPGKTDPKAPLPIWSSIDGHHVTWPWWYRILNLVLQGIMFQPGASALEIHRLCFRGTVEPFEVELVLKWLVSVNAARETPEGTYIVEGGFWAAFGEKLIGTENDWFGDHVKRNKMPEMRQPWRQQLNIRSERVSALLGGETEGDGQEQEQEQEQVLYAESHLQRPERWGRRRRALGRFDAENGIGSDGDVVMGEGDEGRKSDSDSDSDSDVESSGSENGGGDRVTEDKIPSF